MTAKDIMGSRKIAYPMLVVWHVLLQWWQQEPLLFASIVVSTFLSIIVWELLYFLIDCIPNEHKTRLD